MPRHRKIWFVLTDGAKARVLLHRTWQAGRFDEIAHELPQGVRPSADGRCFAHHVAEILTLAAARGLFDALVIVAPSPILATLRRALGASARERLIREEAKDYLSLSQTALILRLASLLQRSAG
jgi:protein required for attachment to host cells